MRSSCIPHPPQDRLILIRDSHVKLMEGDACAAALLSFFIHWHDIKLATQEQARMANDAAEQHGDERLQNESLYQWHTQEALAKALFGIFGRPALKSALKKLAERRYVSITRNPNPKHRFDATRHFLLDPERITADLIKQGLLPGAASDPAANPPPSQAPDSVDPTETVVSYKQASSETRPNSAEKAQALDFLDTTETVIPERQKLSPILDNYPEITKKRNHLSTEPQLTRLAPVEPTPRRDDDFFVSDDEWYEALYHGTTRRRAPSLTPLPPDPPDTFPEQRGRLAKVLREQGVQVTSGHPQLLAWVKAGVTEAMALEAVEQARIYKPKPTPIPAAYLDSILHGITNPPPRPLPFRERVIQQGQAVGVTAIAGEEWDQYAERLRTPSAGGKTAPPPKPKPTPPSDQPGVLPDWIVEAYRERQAKDPSLPDVPGMAPAPGKAPAPAPVPTPTETHSVITQIGIELKRPWALAMQAGKTPASGEAQKPPGSRAVKGGKAGIQPLPPHGTAKIRSPGGASATISPIPAYRVGVRGDRGSEGFSEAAS